MIDNPLEQQTLDSYDGLYKNEKFEDALVVARQQVENGAQIIDVNMDEEINIADVIMMVDIIYGGNARTMVYDMNEIAYVDIVTDYKKSKLGIAIEYQGPIRGIELELDYDPDMVNIFSAMIFITVC